MNFKSLLIIFLIGFSALTVRASHVVGGNIEINQTGPNSYDITLNVFRDCSGTTLPSTQSVSIYEQNTNISYGTVTLTQPTGEYVVDLGDSCYTPTGLCVEQFTYTGSMTLNNNTNGYYFVWDLCCRNAGISNINNPGSAGSLFYTEIPDPAIVGQNDTPVFGPFPSDGYFCVNNSLDIPTTAVDPDGDSLSFTLITPLDDSPTTKPFSPVTWATGYSLFNITGNSVNPNMSIDAVTGTITVNPDAIGIYAFSILVREWRNGVQIGETVRDLQYEALACVLDAPPTINLQDTVTVFVGDSICVDMSVSDADGTDTIYVNTESSNFDLDGTYILPTQSGGDWIYPNFNNTNNDGVMDHWLPVGVNTYQGVGEILLRYCWDPGCDAIDSVYQIDILAYSLGCSGSDTSEKTVNVAVQYAPTPIALDLPQVLEVTYDEEICFEVLVNDVNETGLEMSMLPLGDNFDYSTHYQSPINSGNGYHYYTNFQGLDTVRITDYSLQGTEVFGKDTIGIRYCFTPGCGDVVLTNYELDFRAKIYGDCFTVSEDKTMSVVVDPPIGNVQPIPNVFTPNGDGDNDVFTLSGSNDPCFDEMTVTIFNRWGKKVFESTDALFEWDGTNKNGGDCSEGTYFVLLKGSYGSTYNPSTGERIPNPVDQQYTIQLMR